MTAHQKNKTEKEKFSGQLLYDDMFLLQTSLFSIYDTLKKAPVVIGGNLHFHPVHHVALAPNVCQRHNQVSRWAVGKLWETARNGNLVITPFLGSGAAEKFGHLTRIQVTSPKPLPLDGLVPIAAHNGKRQTMVVIVHG